MRAHEFIIEEFDQARADAALKTAMLTLVQLMRSGLQGATNSSNFKNQMRNAIYTPLYRDYMRKSFDNQKAPFDVKTWMKTIAPLTKSFPDLNIVGQNNEDHYQWTQLDKNQQKKLQDDRFTKKIYFTFDTSTDLERVPDILSNLIKYLADKNTGISGFKLLDSWQSSDESDWLVCYLLPKANAQQEIENIKKIFPSIQRVHRPEIGTDDREFTWGLRYGSDTAREQPGMLQSDSTARVNRLCEYIWNSRDFYLDLLKKATDDQIADYLVKLWKTKFNSLDITSPWPAEKSSSPGPAPAPRPAAGSPAPAPRPAPNSSGAAVVGPLTLTINGVKMGPYNISFPMGRDSLKRYGDDYIFWDIHQFTLEKNRADNTWTLIPNTAAKNKTMINGVAVTTPTKIHKGMRIAAGNPEKKIEKLPMIVA